MNKAKKKTGPPSDAVRDKIVIKYKIKNEPLTFRDLGKIIKEEGPNVYRRYKKLLSSYPQEALDKNG